METTPVEPEVSSAPTTGLPPTALLPGPSSSPTILDLSEADIQQIAQVVATIFKETRGSVLQSSRFGTFECHGPTHW